jgi:hypothetical protein
MQLQLAFLDARHPPDPPQPRSSVPWDDIDPQARAAALEILSRLIARMLTAIPDKDDAHE